MLFLIEIAIVILVVVKIVNKKKAVEAEADKIAPEVINLLHRLQSFLRVNNFDRPNFLLMLIPIDHGFTLYSPRSCKVQISLLLHDDEIDLLKGKDMLNTEKYQWFGKQFFDDRFFFTHDLEVINGADLQECDDRCYYLTCTNNTFSVSYKSLMKVLHPKVVAAFPDIKFEFDGSRILSNKFHK